MHFYYLDETGDTGTDLLNTQQPIFVELYPQILNYIPMSYFHQMAMALLRDIIEPTAINLLLTF
jgi:hypothetical protein